MEHSSDAQLLAGFREWQRRRNLSVETIKVYAYLHDDWLRFLVARGLTLTTASHVDVDDFVSSKRSKSGGDLEPQSRYSYISRISSLYRWLIDYDHTDRNPAARVARPRLPRRLPRPIPTPELAAAWSVADARLRAMLALGSLQGMRRGEVARVRAEDVLLGVSPTLRVNGKGGKERIVPLHPAALAALRLLGIPAHGLIFDKGPGAVGLAVGQHLRRNGSSATMHQLRHWFGTQTYRASHDLLLVAGLMGHESLQTTKGYAAYDPAGGDVVRALSFS